MFQKIIRSVFYSSLISTLVFVQNSALAQGGRCTLNGREIDCAEMANQFQGFFGLGIALIIFSAIFTIVSTIFWIVMLIHAINNDVKDKVLWIILMVFTGFIGAIIYYFAVKRNFNSVTISPTPPTTQL